MTAPRSKNAARIVPASVTARHPILAAAWAPDREHGGVLAARALEAAGVEALFALPGRTHPSALRGRPARGHCRLIGIAARGERRLHGRGLGAGDRRSRPSAAVTAGPGLANALPGIAEANAAGAPVVVIAGRTGTRAARPRRGAGPRPARGGRADHEVAGGVPVRGADPRVRGRGRAPGPVRRPGRRVPRDPPGRARVGRPRRRRAWPAAATGPTRRGPCRRPGTWTAAVALLQSAERPVVLAGSGAFFSGAGDRRSPRSPSRTGIPVDHDQRGPRPARRRPSARAWAGSSTAASRWPPPTPPLVLGSRFNANLRVRGPPAVPARTEGHPGRRAAGAPRRAPPPGGRAGRRRARDARRARRRLDDGRPDAFYGLAGAGRARAPQASRASWNASATAGERACIPAGSRARRPAFADGARRRAPSSRDGGDSVLWGIAMSKAHRPGTNLFIGSAMGTLGDRAPVRRSAAKAARPDEPVFVFTGDGAFGLSAIELDTAARHGLGGRRGRREQRRLGRRPPRAAACSTARRPIQGAELSSMRYDALAQAVGGHGERVTEPAEVRPALERARKAAEAGVPAVSTPSPTRTCMSDLMRNLAAASPSCEGGGDRRGRGGAAAGPSLRPSGGTGTALPPRSAGTDSEAEHDG